MTQLATKPTAEANAAFVRRLFRARFGLAEALRAELTVAATLAEARSAEAPMFPSLTQRRAT